MSIGPNRDWPFAPLVPHHYGVICPDPPWPYEMYPNVPRCELVCATPQAGLGLLG